MPKALLKNGLELDYEQYGDASGEPVLLIMGLGAQRVVWPDAFIDALVQRGFRVTAYDNRDCGLSSHLDDAGAVGVGALCCLGAYIYCCCVGCGHACDAPVAYTLDDLAADCVQFMDAIDLRAAHVVGASMGGMIAQLLAIGHADRVRSLTSIMSTPGARSLPSPTPEAFAVLRSKRPDPRVDMEAYVEATVGAQRVMCGAGNALDEEFARPHIRRAGARCYYPEGSARQFAAIAVAADRTDALRSVQCSVAVVHGRQDPLVPLEHGAATHAAIVAGGNAKCTLHVIDSMGHNLPPHAWSPIADIVHVLAGARTALAHVDVLIHE